MPAKTARAHNRASKAKIAVADRRRIAMDLRRDGLSYREIGTKMGTSEFTAYNDVIAELDRVRAETAEIAEQVRYLELERLDLMLKAHMPAAIGGPNKPPDEKAAATCLRIMERRDRLMGLAQPVKIDTGDTVLRIVLPEGFPEQTPEAMSMPAPQPVPSPTGQPPAIPAPTTTAKT